eukprot:SAG11_NODE_35921_length_264_cov_0.927273_1_plen_67_part_01
MAVSPPGSRNNAAVKITVQCARARRAPPLRALSDGAVDGQTEAHSRLEREMPQVAAWQKVRVNVTEL